MAQDSYKFPTARLRPRIHSPTKTPLVLVACGSFSPITFLHLRMFELAADYAHFNTDFEVVGGYISCVGDAYDKAGLIKSRHRLEMCELAVRESSWVAVDSWEAQKSSYVKTAKVLEHFDYEINRLRGGIETPAGKKRCHIALLAGTDLIHTMLVPNVWAPEDIETILADHGIFIVERAGKVVDESMLTTQLWKENTWIVPLLVHDECSSTKIRLFVQRGMSIQYLVPRPVVQYIEKHRLYVSHERQQQS